MSRRGRVEGYRRTRRALRVYGQNMDAELRAVVNATSDEILDIAKRSIQRRSRGPKRGDRVSSAPGRAPNVQTGELLASLKVERHGMYADVKADKFYASFLEFGTKDIAARPFLRPAMKRRRYIWNRRIREVSKKAAQRAGRIK